MTIIMFGMVLGVITMDVIIAAILTVVAVFRIMVLLIVTSILVFSGFPNGFQLFLLRGIIILTIIVILTVVIIYASTVTITLVPPAVCRTLIVIIAIMKL